MLRLAPPLPAIASRVQALQRAHYNRVLVACCGPIIAGLLLWSLTLLG